MHTPVLLSEALTLLAPRANQRYLDLTAGYGGHAGAILAKTGMGSGAILVDRDEQATTELQRQFGTQLTIWQMPASQALGQLADEHAKFDLILADIGVSSPHLDNAVRGFSFMSDGPLDMRMDRSVGQTAADLVNHLPETELADLIWRYGEERQSRRIAKALVGARPLATTKQLADVILHTVGRPPGSHHPATKTFQALRIAVNNELGELQAMLSIAPQLLNADGRLAIISFHSLEDRLVKQTFAELTDQGYEAEYANLTKKPLTASSDEIAFNPRSRSAKLRGLVKINKKG